MSILAQLISAEVLPSSIRLFVRNVGGKAHGESAVYDSLSFSVSALRLERQFGDLLLCRSASIDVALNTTVCNTGSPVAALRATDALIRFFEELGCTQKSVTLYALFFLTTCANVTIKFLKAEFPEFFRCSQVKSYIPQFKAAFSSMGKPNMQKKLAHAFHFSGSVFLDGTFRSQKSTLPLKEKCAAWVHRYLKEFLMIVSLLCKLQTCSIDSRVEVTTKNCPSFALELLLRSSGSVTKLDSFLPVSSSSLVAFLCAQLWRVHSVATKHIPDVLQFKPIPRAVTACVALTDGLLAYLISGNKIHCQLQSPLKKKANPKYVSGF
jgi:hypothetical protein